MKRDNLDFHTVRPEHIETHERLLNWGRYVTRRFGGGGNCSPMFRQYRSDQVWGHGAIGDSVDPIDGHAIEKLVGMLPEKPREAVRWAYIFVWIHPRKVCRYLAVNPHTLAELIHDGRSMLKNRARLPAETTLSQ